MTPEEAVKQLGNRLDKSERNALGTLFHAVAATAKADETRRCVVKVQELATFIKCRTLAEAVHADTRGEVQGIINRLESLADEIKRSGGLPEESLDPPTYCPPGMAISDGWRKADPPAGPHRHTLRGEETEGA